MSLIASLSRVLEHPATYMLYQGLVGGISARKRSIYDFVKPRYGMAVLDIGCGPGYTIECFPNPQYFGFDISPQYVDHANAKYGARGGKFFCQLFDEATLEWLPKIDAVLLMGVLHHLDDQMAVQLLDLARRAMKPEGKLFTLDGYYGPDVSGPAKFFLASDRGKFIREEAAYIDIAQRVFKSVKAVRRNDYFYIPYSALVMECSQA